MPHPEPTLPDPGRPPIWHADGRVTLYHPESPGVRLTIRPGWLRRLGLRRSMFATIGEVLIHYREDFPRD